MVVIGITGLMTVLSVVFLTKMVKYKKQRDFAQDEFRVSTTKLDAEYKNSKTLQNLLENTKKTAENFERDFNEKLRELAKERDSLRNQLKTSDGKLTECRRNIEDLQKIISQKSATIDSLRKNSVTSESKENKQSEAKISTKSANKNKEKKR